MTSSGPLLDADRALALSYVPAARRASVEALWKLDAALGAVSRAGRDPPLICLKLAWWREALERLDREGAPAEPVLRTVAAYVLPNGVPGIALARMEEGWATLVAGAGLNQSAFGTFAIARGGLLFRYSAELMGARPDADIEQAGACWALVDLARRSGSRAVADAALEAARNRIAPASWPRPLRPLGMLAILARRDADPSRVRWEPQGAPARMVRMLRHRLTGF